MAHFLEAGVSPWAPCLCSYLFPASRVPADPAVWRAALSLPHDALVATLAAAWPTSLAGQLSAAPPAAHAAIVQAAATFVNGSSGLRASPQALLAIHGTALDALAQFRWIQVRGPRTAGPAAAAVLASRLGALAEIASLSFHGTLSGADATAALIATLPPLTALTTLDLSDCGLGATGVSALADRGDQLAGLRRLHLGDNGLSARGAASLATLLPSTPRLWELHLESNSFGSEVHPALIAPTCFSCPPGSPQGSEKGL